MFIVGALILFVAELYVLVKVIEGIGVLPGLALLVILSACGPFLVRRTGLAVWRRARTRLDRGEVPGREMTDGLMLLIAGVAITIPGFITDVVGFALLLPPVRALVRRLLGRYFARRMITLQGMPQRMEMDGGASERSGFGTGFIDADSVDRTPPRADEPRPLPPGR
jgi:UPF0716 protein FxsA